MINPNTVAKAYRELEHEGVIELRHGAGAFVSGNAQAKRITDKFRAGQAIVAAAVEKLRARGVTDEAGWHDRCLNFFVRESAYSSLQSTKPQTIAYALNDSPAGLLAWMVEKYRAWSDCEGELSSRFSDDFLLTQASLYWFTNTISTSFRMRLGTSARRSFGCARRTCPARNFARRHALLPATATSSARTTAPMSCGPFSARR